jgi:hypothetical protein
MSAQKELYVARASRFQAEVERLSARSHLVSNFRGLSFGSAAICGVAAIAGANSSIFVPLALILFAIFGVLVVVHGRVLDALDSAERWVDVNRDAESRLEHAWERLTDQGEGLAPPDHAYAADLDLFGRGSLFQRLSVAHTRAGRERLASLLLEPRSVVDARALQGAVRALSQDLELRQRLEAQALGTVGSRRAREQARRTRSAPNPTPLFAWAAAEPTLIHDALSVWGARVVPLFTIGAGVAAFGFDRSPLPIFAGLVLAVLVLVRSARETRRVFSAVSSTEGAFLRYGMLLEIIEQYETDEPLLRAERERLTTGAGLPSQAMARFRRIVGWFDIRHSIIYPFFNLITLWDVHCTLALEHWRADVGKHLKDWFDVIGWYEAISSLASFAADEPDVHYPELRESETVFRAEGLCHPLLHPGRRVANDVTLPSAGTALLVTGSNMSGKSTLLRAMGISTVLGLSGAPVVARRLELGPLRVATSIRVADSLEQGVSHFLAEVNKLKRVVVSAREHAPVLFLLDEILHGTNSRERQVGARWVLAELLREGAIGAVSTHDEELCRLPPNLMDRVALVHLREGVENGRMTFDYKVYPGPVTSGNALRLMQLVGLDVPLE